MTQDIKIRETEGKWAVRAGGAVIGESQAVLELSEGSYPAVYYFPRPDIAMAFLDQTDHSTHCPHKGDATYFSIVTKSETLENAAWSYETPLGAVQQIKGYLAFYQSDKVQIEHL